MSKWFEYEVFAFAKMKYEHDKCRSVRAAIAVVVIITTVTI